MFQDPGWDLTPRSLARSLTPFRSLRRNDAADASALATLRQLFVSFCLALVLITALVIILGDTTNADARTEISVGVATLAGVASLILGRRIDRTLDCTSDASLVTSYRTRFFLRLAIAEAVTLLAFALGIAVGPSWAYFVGLAFTTIGFAQIAPTRRNLERDETELRARGCHRSISRLLTSASTQPN